VGYSSPPDSEPRVLSIQEVNTQDSLPARLDRVVSIQNSAYERAGSPIQIVLNPGALDAEIERLEKRLGRRLPDETRTLYSWHDGCSVFLVPGLLYRGSEWSIGVFSSISNVRLRALSNAVGIRPEGKMFPVFDMDKVLLTVELTPSSSEGPTPLYCLDFELDQLTMIARSIDAYVALLLRALESRNFEVTRHGLRWTRDPIGLSRTMTPIE
jgi:hypothetical protein